MLETGLLSASDWPLIAGGTTSPLFLATTAAAFSSRSALVIGFTAGGSTNDV